MCVVLAVSANCLEEMGKGVLGDEELLVEIAINCPLDVERRFVYNSVERVTKCVDRDLNIRENDR